MRNAGRFVIVLACAFVLGTLREAGAMQNDLNGLSYRSIGPAISAGRIPAVVGSDRDPLFYLAGGADGGVFVTKDGGNVWTPIFDAAASAAVGAIAVAPNDVRDIWVGTGEANPRNDVAMGDGVWHSTDGGQTWHHEGLDDAGSISSISIDPADKRHVVVGVLGQIFRDSRTRGVFVTSDSGAHWKQTLYVGPSTGVSSLVRLPDHPQTMFAGLWEVRRVPWTLTSGGSSGGIYRSDDGGATWREVQGHGLPAAPTGRIGLTAAPGGRTYAVIQSRAGDLWRSDDGGQQWRLMPHSPYVGARPFYFSSLTVDPANPDSVISAGVVLALSTDGGRTFKQTAANAGQDYHEIWWSHDGKRIAVGNDGGFVWSIDAGATWNQSFDIPVSQAYRVGFDNALPNYHVCAGLQDDSGWCGFANGNSGLGVLNRNWRIVVSGDGGYVLPDPTNPDLIWSTTTDLDTGQIYVWDARTEQAYEASPDAELNWVAPYSLRYRFNWTTPLAFQNDGAALVGGNVVFRSTDQGRHWTIISPELTRADKAHEQVPGGPIEADISGAEISDTVVSLAPSSRDNGLVWAGTDDGLVWITRDGGAHWSSVTPPGAPVWGRVWTIDASRIDAATALVAIDDHMLGDDAPHVYATHDYGASWRSVSGDLPRGSSVFSIRQDVVDPSLLYAGTQHGVWATWDGGTHWRSLRLNMPATAVYDLAIQPDQGDLIVGSHGRGIWILDDLRPLEQLAGAQQNALSVFAPRTTYRWWQWADINAAPGELPANLFAGPNVDYGALITYWLARGHHSATIGILDSTGRVIRHLSDQPHAAGLNRTSWDLAEDGPTRWLGTYSDNRGPKEGAEVLPGTYTVRVTVDGLIQSKSVTVKADPRDPLTMDEMRSRYQTLTTLYAELGDVDAMLNAIDRRLKTASPQAQALRSLRAQLTYDPQNEEDLSRVPQLRERLEDAIDRIDEGGFQAPSQSQLEAISAIHATYTALVREYRELV